MKNLMIISALIFSGTAHALNSNPPRNDRVIATYTDFFNSDEKICTCMVFADGTAMKILNGAVPVVPYVKPQSFKVKTNQFKELDQALNKDAFNTEDDRFCQDVITPFTAFKVSGHFPLVGGELRKVRENVQSCGDRKYKDVVEVSVNSKTAHLMKNICGFSNVSTTASASNSDATEASSAE